jgi:quercetin dioxygenase-like cupin family protein
MPIYGIDIGRLGDLVGTVPPNHNAPVLSLITRPEYTLEQIVLGSAGEHETCTAPSESATVFVEEGTIQFAGATLGRGELLHVPPVSSLLLRAVSPSTAYIFRGPALAGRTQLATASTFDFRPKYWGSIETIVNDEYTGKRLFFRNGQHSSLHFHCAKTETYYIHSGCLLVRLRAGRGEDRWFELPAGATLTIPPGLMHQSGAIGDTVVIEVSTHDEDTDSFLIEDGQRVPMPRLQRAEVSPHPKGRRIVIDLDGCLCTQTGGDYENAEPVPQAIELVNRLFDLGHNIIIHTSRFMGRCHNDAAQVYNQGFAFTEQQLRAWGVRYHLLVMGKPAADVIIDDRAVFFRPDWTQIAEEIEFKLGQCNPQCVLPSGPARSALK